MVNAVPLKKYLVFVVLNYGALIEITVITSKFFKHSQNKMLTHVISGLMILVVGLLNEYFNTGILMELSFQKSWTELSYGLFVINFYMLLILQTGENYFKMF